MTRPRAAWRDVTLRQYRVYTRWSSLAGVALFTFGLYLMFHREVVWGVFLIAAGSATALWTAALRIEGTPAPLYRPDQRGEAWRPRVLHFYTREGCSICAEARLRLERDLAGRGVTIVEHDVDQDGVLAARYGDRVPVAVYAGDEVFALAYDAEAVRRVAL